MTPIDPIELELSRNLFEAAAEEMGITLQRASFSANIKERRDFSCAVFDATGELLAQAAHIPVHLGSMPASVAAVRERLGNLCEGDVAIVNDPFAGGTHLPDITIVSPVYFEGELLGYAANRAHHADVGGVSPGSMTLSRHIDEEGIRLEPALLCRAGVRDDVLLDRLLSAVRTADERRGDLEAQLAANAVGTRSLVRMAESAEGRPSSDTGRPCSITPGVHASLHCRNPGGRMDIRGCAGRRRSRRRPMPIHVRITTGGEHAVVDFRESGDAAAGCVNCPEAVTRSAVYYCFACLMNALRVVPTVFRSTAAASAISRC